MFGIDPKEWEESIPVMAQQALASGSPANNPRVPTAEEIEQLYREVWNAVRKGVSACGRERNVTACGRYRRIGVNQRIVMV